MLALDPLPRSSDGITLRRLTVADLAAFQAYRSDAGLARYQGWSPMTDAEAMCFLSVVSGSALFAPGCWAQIGITEASESSDPGLIGDIGLFLSEDSRHVEIGFTVRRSSQGRGLATAAVRAAIGLALEQTNADQVRGITDARNLASVRLLERVGMHLIDARQALFRGEPCEELVYAVHRGGG